VPRLGPHAELVARRPRLVEPELSVGRVHPVDARPQADDLLDENALRVIDELPEPVQGDDVAEPLATVSPRTL
jgi:hypothetical protein